MRPPAPPPPAAPATVAAPDPEAASPPPPAPPRPAAAQVEAGPDWTLVWADEFDGSSLDPAKWSPVVGGGGYGNNEAQFYTGEPANARIEEGSLVIEARRETREGYDYTSAKLTTQHKGDWTYGRFEIRAKLPFGQGIWPAIWMMPTDYTRYGEWPACGEIDIMELVGHMPGKVFGTLHYGNPWKNVGDSYDLPDGQRFADAFHLFTLEWEPGKMKWYVDGVHYQTQETWYTSWPDAMWPAPFDRDFYLQLNLAVGGNWPGYPDDTTVFPQRMYVDYVRVYRFNGTYPDIPVRPSAPEALRPRAPRPDGNLVYNGDFDQQLEHWALGTYEGGAASAAVVDGALTLSIEEPGTEPWSVQLRQERLDVRRGQTVRVGFDAWADAARDIMVTVSKASQHWDSYSGKQVISLGASRARHTFSFRMRAASDVSARLEFNCGAHGAGVHLDDVRVAVVEELPPIPVAGPTLLEAEDYHNLPEVGTEACTEGGLNVGWIDADDSLEYLLDVQKAGRYTVAFRYANSGRDGVGVLQSDGRPLATLDFPDTGGWQHWQTCQVIVDLPAGRQRLALRCTGAGYNLNWIRISPD